MEKRLVKLMSCLIVQLIVKHSASIANCMWNLRMFMLHGDAKYIDVLERSLYNRVLSGISLDGKKIFLSKCPLLR